MSYDNSTIARPYASAAFEVAFQCKTLSQWSKFLEQAAILGLFPEIQQLLSNPLIAPEAIRDIFLQALAPYTDPQQQNFIKLLAEKRRLVVLPDVKALFETRKAEQEKTLDVDVISAMPFDEAQEQALKQRLKERLQHDVVLHYQIDPSLIGGAVIRAGDLVIDGSVRGKLQRLNNQIAA